MRHPPRGTVKPMPIAALALLAACGSHREAPAHEPPPPAAFVDAAPPTRLFAGVPKLVVGIANDWDATTARLQRYERDGYGWAAVGDPIDAVLGGSGLAWGRGVHGDRPPAGRDGPIKVEDDGRSPAGAFRVVRAYGYDDAGIEGGSLPYAQLEDSWRCVDDPGSGHYNRVFDATGIEVDWTSAEEMREYGELYRWVVEIEHNPTAAPGAGSCIFFHVWGGPRSETAGCTAMARDDLETVLAWLRPGAVYVLLPRDEHDALASAWGLPTPR
jgi:D-alanyl-D-alanine dipeptidase